MTKTEKQNKIKEIKLEMEIYKTCLDNKLSLKQVLLGMVEKNVTDKQIDYNKYKHLAIDEFDISEELLSPIELLKTMISNIEFAHNYK